MRILVTGASGSLAREIIPRLLDTGHEIRGVDNFKRYGIERPPEGIEFIQGDLTDPETVRQAVHGMDAIIQGAAQIYGVAGFHRYPADILQLDTTLHGLVLRAALDAGVQRVVYISSSMVYEREEAIAREENVTDMLVPLTDYGLSKLMGERLSRAFADQYGLPFTIWRPFNIIGLHESADGMDPGVSHVFADFVRRIMIERQNPMDILGSGEQIRCFTWIGDVAGAIARHSFDPATRNQDFNLGNPEPVTMIELARRIKSLSPYQSDGELRFCHLPVYADDVQVRIPSIDKAWSVLGWEPRVTLDEMLRRVVDHTLASQVAAS